MKNISLEKTTQKNEFSNNKISGHKRPKGQKGIRDRNCVF